MSDDVGQLEIAQADGSFPHAVASGSPAGESGISLLGARFKDGAHFHGTLRQNLILFPKSQITFDCRLADRRLYHAPHVGSLAICPAGIDCGADGDGSIDIAMVMVDQSQLSLAAGETTGGYGRLRDSFIGDDPALFLLARQLWRESASGYINGPLYWSQLGLELIRGLLLRHSSEPTTRPEGMLDLATLTRVRHYVLSHLGDPLDIPTLAAVAGRSSFHFARVFAHSVGMTPHRYVTQLRLKRAAELLAEGRMRLADIAACTGFADQSHLSRWFKRAFGVSPSQVRGSRRD